MKTNFQMLKELKKTYKPERRGFITKEEQNLIESTLCLSQMDMLQLRNLRDFTVLYFKEQGEDTLEVLDKISAITTLIDNEIWKKGGMV